MRTLSSSRPPPRVGVRVRVRVRVWVRGRVRVSANRNPNPSPNPNPIPNPIPNPNVEQATAKGTMRVAELHGEHPIKTHSYDEFQALLTLIHEP